MIVWRSVVYLDLDCLNVVAGGLVCSLACSRVNACKNVA